MSPSLLNHLDLHGFVVASAVLEPSAVDELRHAIDDQLPNSSVGVRALVSKVESVRLLSHSSIIRALIEPVLGVDAQLVRSVFFNKSNETNWHVGWHQDLSIAVNSMHDVVGFLSWTMKDGVNHVQPPREVLEQMLTVRLHLDDADDSNGALRVSPGSHRLGRIAADEAASIAEQTGKQLCAVNAGDAMLLRPLLLHASKKATSMNPRRVIHLEFSGTRLPPPLSWAKDA